MSHPRRAFLRIAAVLTTSLGVSLGGAPAHAAVHQHHDPVDDTVQRRATTAAGAPTASLVPGNGDVVAMMVAHRRETVDVLVEMMALETVGDAVGVRVRLRTPAGTWVVAVTDRERSGERRQSTRMRAPGTGRVGCRGLEGELDPDLGTATVRVPRACLGGRPGWVRVGATSRLRDGRQLLLDDALRRSKAPRRTTLSPRVPA